MFHCPILLRKGPFLSSKNLGLQNGTCFTKVIGAYVDSYIREQAHSLHAKCAECCAEWVRKEGEKKKRHRKEWEGGVNK